MGKDRELAPSSHLLSGFLSSTLTTLLLHPLDVIRLSQIANDTKLIPTIRNLGGGLYRALPISLAAYVSTYSIFFPCNTYLKLHTPFENKYALYTFATIPPSLIAMSVCNPLWTIKAHQVANGGTLISSLRHVYETSGYVGFYKGLLFGYLNSLNGIISFALYDIFKDNVQATSINYIWCSLASKTIATLVCFPVFALRIRQQVDQMSLGQTMASVIRRPLYNGILATLAQQLPKHTILLFTFETINNILK